MVFDAFRRMFTRAKEGGSISPGEAEVRLKSLKGKLVRVKSEQKRLFSEVEKSRTITPERKQEAKGRLRELDQERTLIVKEMKGLQRRLPKK